MPDDTWQAPTRKCAATGRPLADGDAFYAALVERGGRLVRVDFAPGAWSGPPEGCFAHWKGRIPPVDRPAKPTFNDGMLLELFENLYGQGRDERGTRLLHVLGLLLMRRKRLRAEGSPPGGPLRLRCPKSGRSYELPDPGLGESELAEVQDEIFQALGWA